MGARPSYVASVLQKSGLMSGYFDLYTTTAHPMNIYSKFFEREGRGQGLGHWLH
jgi:hypothetical protein